MIVLGLDAKLYRNEGTYEAPSWVEMTNVKDLTLGVEMGEADVTSRAAEGWRQTEPTLADATIGFQMVWNTEDDDFDAVQESFFDREAIEYLALDGPVDEAGHKGLRATMKCFSFNRAENLEEALMVDVNLKPSYQADHPPEWYETV